jgi:hypothetical protein
MFKTFSVTLLGLLAVSAVRAQSSQPIKVKIPFDFAVKNTTLEAGSYRLTFNSISHILLIQGLGANRGRVAVFADLAVAPHSSSNLGELIFQCRGDDCRLARVGRGAGEGGLEVLQSRHKRAVAQAGRLTLVTIPTE